ncbi:right-handed parallel beta-helix repeat-containing protein [Klebsiella variicola]|uniref:right-handed parallel beta-helix repeat-containing protein n=1 Tax=Klebsiella variicola TaxID=244366 RepID=UPI0022A4F015|nr:right-handed parallel beta-helix repeat-containing protein [Klebsiella variicola]HDG8026429.1 right-handed parallel beta-helix repeat-containing protein [Klebsiella variicola]
MNRRQFSFLLVSMGISYPWLKSPYSLAQQVNNVNNKVINILDYGCKAFDPSDTIVHDNRISLQKILDYCHEMSSSANKSYSIYIPKGTFYVSSTSLDSSHGIPGAFCLQIYSNIKLYGEGTLKLLPKQYGVGAFFRILASDQSNKISNVIISGITLDGNNGNQVDGIQASNILLECANNIQINNVVSKNANGNGILIRGSKQINNPVEQVLITGCVVSNCRKIGIQVSQFKNLKIYNNKISNCSDNGIDIYGDIGRNPQGLTNGNDFEIYSNNVTNCLNGIFPETVSNGRIFKNTLADIQQSAIHVNRIHGMPANIYITENVIQNIVVAFTITGDMANVIIKNNHVKNVKDYFFSFGGGKGNASGVIARDNILEVGPAVKAVVRFSGLRVNNIQVNANRIISKNNNNQVPLQINNALSLNKNSVSLE